ncbi:tRNA dihydrouridine(20/20a) synthase DusA [uncultured Martelella sp.]|uniref:tRNA dihydrouridine(20/20a) synthase DusA n=1 Tax=uncultured Martelella sp. TaxID=392331 RepID=UPI0029C701DB|nr:tRNA dihydrouridine(20/20a) synthase DusA [uncultured Martelella sp.]
MSDNVKNSNEINVELGRRFAIAPMIDWTDRHCRYFHRQLVRGGQVYTEMIVADAVLRGDRGRLLGFDDCEHPMVLQLGGSDPERLAEAARIGADFGYDEIGLNVGCPSDRVQSGTFGACLMQTPEIVEKAVLAMKAAVDVPVSVKCRIGVDDQDPETVLPDFVARMADAGADAVWIHARKAWLKGLSPKENRTIPPLDYGLVHRMKVEFPDLFIGVNGGITTLDEAEAQLAHVDGVMLGRAAYQTPRILAEVDHRLFGQPEKTVDLEALCRTMMDYAERQMGQGVRLSQITRHMIGLFSGYAGARRYRQILSTEAPKQGAGPEVIAAAFAAVEYDAETV